MLDFYKLQIFSVVVQEGSFSAAAERLYITQSAVSQHIKDLEASLGRKLFQRGWRGVKLTPHGEVLSRFTDEIFALVSKAENALTDIESLSVGRVSIGATPGIGIYLAPEWVQRFRARYPQLSVALHTGVTDQIVADVLARRLDIGFTEGELDDRQQGRLSSLVLDDVEQHVVVGAMHPLWDAGRVSLDDLHAQSFIMRQMHSQSRTWLERTLRQRGIEPHIGAEFDNLESIKRSLLMGQCVAVLPPYVVQSEVEQGTLRAIPVEGKPFTRSLQLIWQSTASLSPVTRAFLAELTPVYPALASMTPPVT